MHHALHQRQQAAEVMDWALGHTMSRVRRERVSHGNESTKVDEQCPDWVVPRRAPFSSAPQEHTGESREKAARTTIPPDSSVEEVEKGRPVNAAVLTQDDARGKQCRDVRGKAHVGLSR